MRLVKVSLLFALVTLILAYVPTISHAQEPVNLTIARGENYLTIYLSQSGPVSLRSLRIGVPIGVDSEQLLTRNLSDYPAFRGLDPDNILAPICFHITTVAPNPLLVDCQAENVRTIRIEITEADVFWIDQNRQPQNIIIASPSGVREICPALNALCEVLFMPAPTPTPLPTMTLTPTSDSPATPVQTDTITTTILDDPNVRISWPPPAYVLRGNFDIMGSTNHAEMLNYFIEFRPLLADLSEPGDTVSWLPATLPSAQRIQDGVLGVWDTTTMLDGLYELRLVINTPAGERIASVVYPLRIANQLGIDSIDLTSIDSNAVLAWPPPVWVMRDEFEFFGTANLPEMIGYFIEVRPLNDDLSVPDPAARWIPIVLPANTPVQNDRLGTFNTQQMLDGLYEMQLVISRSQAEEQIAHLSPIRIENNPPPFAVPTVQPTPVTPDTPVPTTAVPPTPVPTNPPPPTTDPTPRVTPLDGNVNVRTGDSTAFPVIAQLIVGQEARVLGESSNGSGWFLIALPDGRSGWVAAFVVETLGDFRGLPLVAPPPPPTPIPPTPITPTITLAAVRCQGLFPTPMDNFAAGFAAGECMADRGVLYVGCLSSNPNDNAQSLRCAGAGQALAEAGGDLGVIQMPVESVQLCLLLQSGEFQGYIAVDSFSVSDAIRMPNEGGCGNAIIGALGDSQTIRSAIDDGRIQFGFIPR